MFRADSLTENPPERRTKSGDEIDMLRMEKSAPQVNFRTGFFRHVDMGFENPISTWQVL